MFSTLIPNEWQTLRKENGQEKSFAAYPGVGVAVKLAFDASLCVAKRRRSREA